VIFKLRLRGRRQRLDARCGPGGAPLRRRQVVQRRDELPEDGATRRPAPSRAGGTTCAAVPRGCWSWTWTTPTSRSSSTGRSAEENKVAALCAGCRPCSSATADALLAAGLKSVPGEPLRTPRPATPRASKPVRWRPAWPCGTGCRPAFMPERVHRPGPRGRPRPSGWTSSTWPGRARRTRPSRARTPTTPSPRPQRLHAGRGGGRGVAALLAHRKSPCRRRGARP
jgi:hypothetical protein